MGEASEIRVVTVPVPAGDEGRAPRQLVAVQIRLHRRRNFGTGRRLAFIREGAWSRNDQYETQRDAYEFACHDSVSIHAVSLLDFLDIRQQPFLNSVVSPPRSPRSQ